MIPFTRFEPCSILGSVHKVDFLAIVGSEVNEDIRERIAEQGSGPVWVAVPKQGVECALFSPPRISGTIERNKFLVIVAFKVCAALE
jgi:hypothetical protein